MKSHMDMPQPAVHGLSGSSVHVEEALEDLQVLLELRRVIERVDECRRGTRIGLAVPREHPRSVLVADLRVELHAPHGTGPHLEGLHGTRLGGRDHLEFGRQIHELVGKVAATEANVLITGENGTGKELVARAVHRRSERAAEVFVSVDMGALSSTLIESELFGHVKGAFTDAREDRPGRFELASGGTLLLDEIGNLPLDLQPKLLSALETRQVTRVGSGAAREIDIRLITATNVSLPEMVGDTTEF